MVLIGKTKSDIIPQIAVDGKVDIKIPFVLGFDKTTIIVTAECDEGASISVTKEATVLLFLVLIN